MFGALFVCQMVLAPNKKWLPSRVTSCRGLEVGPGGLQRLSLWPMCGVSEVWKRTATSATFRGRDASHTACSGHFILCSIGGQGKACINLHTSSAAQVSILLPSIKLV